MLYRELPDELTCKIPLEATLMLLLAEVSLNDLLIQVSSANYVQKESLP